VEYCRCSVTESLFTVEICSFSVETRSFSVETPQLLRGNHWAIILLEEVLLSLASQKRVPFSCHAVMEYDGIWLIRRLGLGMGIGWGFMIVWHESITQKSVAKNMADFHVCLRHLVPFGNGIYHWQTAMLRLWRCLSPPWIFDKTEKCFCFELKIFFSYFACFTNYKVD
jgi:hypothetical protein